ncbi:pilus assembly protein [Vibrio sp. Isolate33]|uniref:TadE/TadG family type IV pilus assembly protein n=1 Tax=Vibrio sp. Isolate33 TaxID=2908539 RepID=UPI001EFE360F|nr:TadE/TadG family type IV pilus assembly protein [Vibrio sp. Isolate33]MCG9543704.1 pilus assembly protein [Vibrio sp. Isolate33]
MMKANLSLRKKQQGVAAIWLALALVPVMGFTFLSVEGTRYIQTSARLNDSLEAAAIAVTIADYRDENETNKLATDYVKAYVRGAKDIGITSEWEHQEWIEATETPEHIQYRVAASTTHQSWFASQFIPSFDETQVITGQSVAKKYPVLLGDNNIDLMLVSDFSGSMNWRWGSRKSCTYSSCKINDLKDAVRSLAETVLCHEVVKTKNRTVCSLDDTDNEWANRIGIVPFNIRTREVVSGITVAASQLMYRGDVTVDLTSKKYLNVNWNAIRDYELSYLIDCVEDVSECDDKDLNKSGKVKGRIIRAYDVLTSSHDEYPDNTDYVDYQASVDHLLTNKVTVDLPVQTPKLKRTYYQIEGVELYKGYGSSADDQFNNIALTNNLISLLGVNVDGTSHSTYGVYDMKAGGSTAAFQGMLRGFQLLAVGKPETNDPDEIEDYNNKLKMLFVLTDGQESPNNGIFGGLVDAGMCDKARELIPGLFIGVIGIDFQASQQSGYQDCVLDSKDIIDVTNLEQLKESIEELIRRGAKSNGVTQLY